MDTELIHLNYLFKLKQIIRLGDKVHIFSLLLCFFNVD